MWMDSSSDGSCDFAWTDASDDSTSSETMAKESVNEAHSEDESVSGKVYKEQLQDELFACSNGDLPNGGLPNGEHKHMKQKHIVTEEHRDSEHVIIPKKKKIKREPESDVDATSPKCKTNLARHNGQHSSYDESYLNLKVKAEDHHFVVPSSPKKQKNKNKLKCDSVDENKLSLDSSTEKSFKSYDNSSEEMELDENHLNSLVHEENNSNEKKAKKKKKKSRNRKDSTSEDISEPKETLHLTTLAPPTPDDSPPASADSDASCQSDTHSKRSANSTITDQDKHVDRFRQPSSPLNRKVSCGVPADSPKRQPSMSERLQFEEDNSLDLGNSQVQRVAPTAKSSKIKAFLKNNLNLKPVTSQLLDDAMLTDDDELWIIRCPKEVNVGAFLNKNITCQGKCKVKLDGQTYEGAMDCESGNISILSSEHSGFLIQNLPVKGHLNLRKRIPKSLTQVDAIANQSLTSFIALPETKCRHPLFGSNYRKAIKLRSSVTERLKQANSSTLPDCRATRLNKKQKADKTYQESNHPLISSLKADRAPRSPVKPEPESDYSHSPLKKKKKRKHLHCEQTSSTKSKRTKHDLESAEAWESEQAIEENLFNF